MRSHLELKMLAILSEHSQKKSLPITDDILLTTLDPLFHI